MLIKVGDSWSNGREITTVVGIHPTGRFVVDVVSLRPDSTPDRYLFSPDDLEKQRVMDEKNAASRQKQKEAEAAESAESMRRQAALEASPFGQYLMTFKPMQRGKAEDALKTLMVHRGSTKARHEIIESLIRDGWEVADMREGRVIMSAKDGSYLPQKVLTKTGLDYASWLVDQKNSGRFSGLRSVGYIG